MSNEHLQAIHAECSGFVDGDPPDLEVIIQHAEALAARVEEREAQLRLIAPVVSAALEMFQWEGSTDYPDGDPEVIKRRRAFRDALYHLDDIHYDELDFLDDFQPGDLPPNDGSNGR